MNRKKILITYATAGIGHKKAAYAIKAALENKKTPFFIRIVNVLDYTNPFFKKSYPSIYLLLVNRLILLWGFFYYLLDFRIMHFLLYPLRVVLGVLNSKPFINFLIDFKPDVVVCTQFFATDICTYVKQKYKINMKLIEVITDYRLHSFWVSNGVDTYIGGHDMTRMDLIRKWEAPPYKIKVMGIPIEPKFSIKHDKDFFKRKLNLPSDSFIILLMGGGYGVGPILKILKVLNKSTLRLRSGLMVSKVEPSNLSLSVIVVCGHNKKLYNRINAFEKNANLFIKNYPYVDNIDELMATADVYVGKAGGICITEALAQNLPLIFIKPIPGQESRNEDLIIRMGAGIRLKRISDIIGVIENLKDSKQKIQFLKKNIKNMKRINAANDIADFVIGCVQNR